MQPRDLNRVDTADAKSPPNFAELLATNHGDRRPAAIVQVSGHWVGDNVKTQENRRHFSIDERSSDAPVLRVLRLGPRLVVVAPLGLPKGGQKGAAGAPRGAAGR
jgi:hypothetical protein